ncbi:MAG: LamG-like jellyroll fold domain-containing protein [Candidatus Paceibacterota bacterium]|jgi:prepilin-type N-terminal cleavage/methylation domain-containing protein
MNKLARQAFTLIELLVVIAIIGILSGLIVISMNASVNSANDTKRKAGIDTIRKALTYYGVLNGGTYPALSRCTIKGDCSFPNTFLELLPNLPTDPVSGNYFYSSNGTTFNISATLSNSTYYNYSSLDGFTSVDNTSLVANWPMHEGSGSTIYDKAGTNNGTISGANWVGNSLSFNGSNSYVNQGNGSNFNFTDAVTVEAWIKTAAFGTNEYRGIVGRYSETQISGCGYQYGLSSNWSTGNYLEFWAHKEGFGDCNGMSYINSSMISLNTWYHVVGTYDSVTGIQKLYLNGALNSSASMGAGLKIRSSSNQAMAIGRAPIGYWYFNGLIDGVRVYNRALTQAEVISSYNAQKLIH